jgi:hypothetical protein
MEALTERLEIRLPTRTMCLLRERAQQQETSVAQLVRHAIEFLLEEDQQARLQAAEALFRVEAPVADWDTMKQEIVEARMRSG